MVHCVVIVSVEYGRGGSISRFNGCYCFCTSDRWIIVNRNQRTFFLSSLS